MEKAELKGMIANGNIPAGTEYKAALKDVLQAFPYFQLAQVLFAKQMYDTHEPEASGCIKLASVYAPDRKAMYLLFKASNNQPQTDTTKHPGKEDVKYNFVYSSTKAESIKSTDALPKKEDVKRSPIQKETFIRKELVAKQPLPISIEKASPAIQRKSEEKETIASPAKKAYSPPIIEEKKSLQEKKEEHLKGHSAEGSTPVKIDKPLTENKELEATILEATINDIKANEPISDNSLKYSFISWLKVIPGISVERQEEIKPVNRQKTSGIIEAFIKKAPSISRPKAEFFSSVKAAKMSNAEDDSIVSETLAKIYFTQGNLPKALKAYEVLLLQFPEKSTIFAPRIEEIKALLRENTKPGTK